MNTITIYGIPNCDTTKKTLQWYGKKNILVDFVDLKRQGLRKQQLAAWCKKVGWETLLNKKSTTWRSLTTEEQQFVTGEPAAIQLMLAYPTLIKRPVIEMNDTLLVGFNEKHFSKH